MSPAGGESKGWCAAVGLRGHRLTIGLLAGLVTVLIIGSSTALFISNHQRGLAGTAGAGQRSTVAVRTPSTSPGPAAAAAPTAHPAVTTGSGPVTRSLGPSNNLTVQMTPAVRSHPRSAAAQQLLQGYFDAINQHDYASWTQVVSPAMAARQDSAGWLQAYATTVDSSIWMESMSDDPLQVRMRFTSVQDPDLAPRDLPLDCIDWTLTYQITDHDGQLAVSSTVEGSITKTRC